MSKEDFNKVDELEEVTYAYVWDVVFYKSDDSSDENKIRPVRIKSITKHCGYKTSTSPIITAKMTFSIFDIVTLSEMQKSCICDCTCTALKYTKSKTGAGLENTDREIIFSNNFVPIFDKGTFKNFYNKGELAKKKMMLEKNSGDSSLNTYNIDVNMILVNTIAQNMFKTMFCQVIDSGNTIGTVLQWIVSELNINKAIVDDPDNGTELGDIIIPPMNTVQTLKYLQAVYGIYYNDIEIFYDNDEVLYILNKFATDHDCEAKESNITHLYIKNGDDEISVGKMNRKENENGEGVYVGTIPMEYDSNEILDSETMGDAFVFSSFKQGLNAVTFYGDKPISSTASPVGMALLRNSGSHESSGNKALTDYDELNNSFNMFSYMNSLEALAQRYTVVLNDCRITDFKPNKLVELHFEDVDKNNEHGGVYFLNSVTYEFKRSVEFEINPNEFDENNVPLTTTMCGCAIEISRKNPDTK